jgi:hypothetical protein
VDEASGFAPPERRRLDKELLLKLFGKTSPRHGGNEQFIPDEKVSVAGPSSETNEPREVDSREECPPNRQFRPNDFQGHQSV